MRTSVMSRDPYIDFMRAIGLLMLVVAHTWAPVTLASIRSFDVPLMVFVSSICYKPVQLETRSLIQYIKKRLLRIYIPVFVFINIFFLVILIIEWYKDIRIFSIYQYIGSLCLLNYPSIGYVWIMRVFLMIAIILPFIQPLITKLNWLTLSGILVGIIISQHFLIGLVDDITNIYFRYFCSQIILYIWGYLVFVILGLTFKRIINYQRYFYSLIFLIGIIVYVYYTKNIYPQIDKYPPHGLYLLYGCLGCCIIYLSKPIFSRISEWKVWNYLSRYSMWLYLWHIIPVYYITPESIRPQEWIVRYVFVLSMALVLNYIYQYILSLLPLRFKHLLS